MRPSPEDELRAAQDQFVLEWGRLSSSWGINRTMAQIHALLLITGRPHSMDEIIQRLGISRGNASMNLRNLMQWRLVQRFRRPGERNDTYLGLSDVLQVFIRVARERKRREIDPTASAIRDCLAMLPASASESPEAEVFRGRLQDLLDLFAIIDAVYDRMFRSDADVRESIKQFAEDEPGGEGG